LKDPVKALAMLKIPRYPKATENRLHGHDKAVIGAKRSFLKAASINFVILQLLFFALFAYIFGSIYQQGSHIHNMNVLYVDYDGGIVGTAVKDAYAALQGKNFPTLLERSPSQFPTPEDIENVVCSTRYWAAIYTTPGATTRLETALAGGSAATEYNRSDVLTYIWNEAPYSAVVDSDISSNLQSLSSAARLAYTSINGSMSFSEQLFTDSGRIHKFCP
jgi:hypothetical protein